MSAALAAASACAALPRTPRYPIVEKNMDALNLRAAALAAIVALASPLAAQTAAVAPDTAAVSASKLTLARKLRGLMTIEYAVGTVSHPPLLGGNHPAASAEDRAIGQAEGRWARRYMPADSLAEIEARAIARAFDEQELRDLVAFFSSPTARRVVAAQPRLVRAVSAATMRVMAAHRQEMIDTARGIARRSVEH